MVRKIILIIICLLLYVSNGCKETNIEGNLIDKENADNSNNTYKILRIASSNFINSLNSSIANDRASAEVLGNTMEGLFVLTGNNELKNGVCESYTVSEDGKTYTFKLRKDSKWSNGEPVTAHDFVFAWRRFTDPYRAPYYMKPEIRKIKNYTAISNGEMPVEKLGVNASDNYTLVVELEEPVPFFTSLLAYPAFLPVNERFVEEKGVDYGTTVENTLFNGPYILDEWTPHYHYTYKKNESYWNKDSISIDEIKVTVFRKMDIGLKKYLSGEIDYVDVTKEQISEYYVEDFVAGTNFPHDDLISIPSSAVYYLEINHNNEIMKNINFRKALALSIDKCYITDEILRNGSIAADYIVPSNFVIGPDGKDFREITNNYNRYNPKEAKKYWEKAKEDLGIKEATIVIWTYDIYPYKKLCNNIKDQFEVNLEGLSVEVKYPDSLSSSIKCDGTEDIVFSGWGADYLDPMTFLKLWTKGQPLSHLGFSNGYSNKEYDSIIEGASTGDIVLNPEKRWSELQRAERFLLEEDVAFIPLYQREGIALLRSNVKNWDINTLPPHRYWGAMNIVEK